MIRKATINDCSRIAEIHVFGWRCAYKDFISLDYLFNKMTIKKREESFLVYLSVDRKTDETYVYEEEQIIKGFMTMGDCRDDDKDSNTFELQGIYIDPIFQRQHIGTKFVDYCINEAIKKNKKEIVLWVFEKNNDSIEFYAKQGFLPDGKNKLYEAFNEKAIRINKKLE
ncbi:MAG: GNAT family N-acetyltransferase [Treponema sp.]|jgi:L-amino acid N-acyltransferase YncA|nr:GNAT family N-acetyltransferase [Treponema sp.]